MTPLLILLAAVALDFLVGDPRRVPHITRGCGYLIIQCERILYREKCTLCRSFCFTLTVCFSVLVCYFLVKSIFQIISPNVGVLLDLFVIYQCIAAKDLWKHIVNIENPLLAGDIKKARHALSMIVGRDTEQLDEQEISRATLESASESLSDGVIAPLFWAILLGAPGALLYRTVNTLDSMVGYKNERYRTFGRISARLDDILNYIPARITAILILGVRAFSLIRIVKKEAALHASPNAGWPEAALAHRMNCTLGGSNSYQNVRVCGPVFNASGMVVTPDKIKLGRHICLRAYMNAILFFSFSLFCINII